LVTALRLRQTQVDFTGDNVADIFLSYAREGIKKAELLATALAKQGWAVFWD
jgi:hypothetical protein